MSLSITEIENRQEISSAVIRFAGDSGDGMQVVGDQFSNNSAIAGNDISTFPDFPAEIRAPRGTLPGVSGFQIHFGSTDILTPGDAPDALVAMNPAALKVNLPELREKGLLVVNKSEFTKENLKKAGYKENPLDDESLEERYSVLSLNITQLTNDALKDSPLKSSDKSRCKNFFALGLMYFVYGKTLDYTLEWLEAKYAKKPDIVEANQKALKAGYYLGETLEQPANSYYVNPAPIEKGLYRKITGNEAISFGLVAAAKCAGIDLVYGSYPITPASDILKHLSALKQFEVKTFQAEDEIAAVGIAIGASFAGHLGCTGTSGPGLCLKSESIGLAVITELPLVVINVQRGGPSTGLPTKTEQSDLLQAYFGRNGESPVVILAARSPSDCYEVGFEAGRIALTYNTPVIVLSDMYVASGSEPWKIPNVKDLPDIHPSVHRTGDGEYEIYKRDEETLSRKHAIPGTPGFEHQIGGLEKNEQGGVSYDPENHETMTELRNEKIQRIAHGLPPIEINGEDRGRIMVLGWGSSYGAITTAVNQLQEEDEKVSSVHLRYLNPLPRRLDDLLKRFEIVLIPELNSGQLAFIIRGKYLIDTLSYTKVQGRPFGIAEIYEKIKELL